MFMQFMDQFAAHCEKVLANIGLRDCLIFCTLCILALLFFFSRSNGWHHLAKYYPTRNPYQGKWIGSDLDEMEVQFNHSKAVNAIRLGADSQGLYLSAWIGFRPFHPPLFIPWSDVTGVRIKEVPWLKEPNLVKFSFAMKPDIPVYVGTDIAAEVEKNSQDQWKILPFADPGKK